MGARPKLVNGKRERREYAKLVLAAERLHFSSLIPLP